MKRFKTALNDHFSMNNYKFNFLKNNKGFINILIPNEFFININSMDVFKYDIVDKKLSGEIVTNINKIKIKESDIQNTNPLFQQLNKITINHETFVYNNDIILYHTIGFHEEHYYFNLKTIKTILIDNDTIKISYSLINIELPKHEDIIQILNTISFAY